MAKKWSIGCVSLLVLLVSLVIFLYGTAKLAMSQDTTPPVQVDAGIKGVEVKKPEDTEMRDRAFLFIAGASVAGFIGLLGLGYALWLPSKLRLAPPEDNLPPRASKPS